ncbi:MAG: hypothetical protein ACOYNL_08145 [Rickettsiales bacterium]
MGGALMVMKANRIAKEHYESVEEAYVPISTWDKPITNEQMPRLMEITEQLLNNGAVIQEAARVIHKHQVYYYNHTQKQPVMTDDLTQKLGNEEEKALLFTVAMVIAEQEFKRGKPMTNEQVGALAVRVMEPLYKGKNNIQSIDNNGYCR